MSPHLEATSYVSSCRLGGGGGASDGGRDGTDLERSCSATRLHVPRCLPILGPGGGPGPEQKGGGDC